MEKNEKFASTQRHVLACVGSCGRVQQSTEPWLIVVFVHNTNKCGTPTHGRRAAPQTALTAVCGFFSSVFLSFSFISNFPFVPNSSVCATYSHIAGRDEKY